MPYPMTHLLIAKKVSEKSEKVKDRGSFMLGALAPDSVHMRKEYNSEVKKKTHLCAGDEKWGQVTKNDEWQKNIICFLERNSKSSNIDFYLGYAIHVLTDMLWNIEFWSPFRFYCIENYGEFRACDEKRWRQECILLDYFLYKENEDYTIWSDFGNGSLEDIPDMIYEEDIVQLKDQMINKQYKNKDFNDCSKNKLIRLDAKLKFIEESNAYITNILSDKV